MQTEEETSEIFETLKLNINPDTKKEETKINVAQEILSNIKKSLNSIVENSFILQDWMLLKKSCYNITESTKKITNSCIEKIIS